MGVAQGTSSEGWNSKAAKIKVPLKMSSSFLCFISPQSFVLSRAKQGKLLFRAHLWQELSTSSMNQGEGRALVCQLPTFCSNKWQRRAWCRTTYSSGEMKGQESFTPGLHKEHTHLSSQTSQKGPNAAFWGMVCQSTFALPNHFNHKQSSNRKWLISWKKPALEKGSF